MAKTRVDFDDPFVILLIESYSSDGMADYEIAEALGYNATYFSELQRKFPKIAEAIKKGRRPMAKAVENAMFKKALGGFTTKTVVKKWIEDPRFPDEKVMVELVQETEIEHAPDTGAGAFILKQRKPEMYNKQPIRVDVTTDGEKVNQSITVIELPEHLRPTEEEEEE